MFKLGPSSGNLWQWPRHHLVELFTATHWPKAGELDPCFLFSHGARQEISLWVPYNLPPHSLSLIPGSISWIIQTTLLIETATQLRLGHYLFYICSLIFTGFTQSACAALASETPNLVIAASPLLRQTRGRRGEDLIHIQYTFSSAKVLENALYCLSRQRHRSQTASAKPANVLCPL